MHNPFIIGRRIYLRPLEKTDISATYLNWLNNEDISKYNSHAVIPETEEDLVNYIASAKKYRTILPFAIIVKKTKKHIGNASLQSIDWITRSAEFAVLVGEKVFWNKGIGYEVGRLLFDYGFGRLNLNRISCGTLEHNVGMIRLAEKLGMIEEGRRRNAIYKSGKFSDVIEFGILRNEYESNNKK